MTDLESGEVSLAAAREAVEIYCSLSAEQPAEFLQKYAGSLDALADAESKLGWNDHALHSSQEAVGIYRRLVKQEAEAPADILDPILYRFAASLHSLAACLSDLGRPEDALAAGQEAVEVTRGLAERNPETSLPLLAQSLMALASSFTEAGRPDEAAAAMSEAVDIRRAGG